MKKFLPFVFPAIALVLVMFLGYRWYTERTTRPAGKISEFGGGANIENVTQADLNTLRQPVKDISTVTLTGGENAMGQVRYEVKDGRIAFTVAANLPKLDQGVYQVWLKEVNGEAKRKAFELTEDKGGYTGSAAISADTLPFEVVVTKELRPQDDEMELIMLRGTIHRDTQTGESSK